MSVLKHTNPCLDCKENNCAVWKFNTDTDTDTDTIFLFFFFLYNINFSFSLRLCVFSSLFFTLSFSVEEFFFCYILFCFVCKKQKIGIMNTVVEYSLNLVCKCVYEMMSTIPFTIFFFDLFISFLYKNWNYLIVVVYLIYFWLFL